MFDTVADLKQAALKIEKLDEETTYTDEIPVEDQASAARLVLKQAHASWRQAQGSGSILATKNWSRTLKTIQRLIPSNLIQISTGYEPNCCLCYAGTRKENPSPNWEELYTMGILDAR